MQVSFYRLVLCSEAKHPSNFFNTKDIYPQTVHFIIPLK